MRGYNDNLLNGASFGARFFGESVHERVGAPACMDNPIPKQAGPIWLIQHRVV